jgi:hypothetical protein
VNGTPYGVASCDCIAEDVCHAVRAWILGGRSMDSIELSQLCVATLAMATLVESARAAAVGKPLSTPSLAFEEYEEAFARGNEPDDAAALSEYEEARAPLSTLSLACDEYEDAVRALNETMPACKAPFFRLIASDSAVRRVLVETAWALDLGGYIHKASTAAWGAAACADVDSDAGKAIASKGSPLTFVMARFSWTADQAVLALALWPCLSFPSTPGTRTPARGFALPALRGLPPSIPSTVSAIPSPGGTHVTRGAKKARAHNGHRDR